METATAHGEMHLVPPLFTEAEEVGKRAVRKLEGDAPTPFVDRRSRVYEVGAVLREPAKPVDTARFFVRSGLHAQLAAQAHARTLEEDRRHRARRHGALHVAAAPAPDAPVSRLAPEWRDRPEARVFHRHDIGVSHQRERPFAHARATRARQHRNHIAPPCRALDHFGRDAFGGQFRGEKVCRRHLVACGHHAGVDGFEPYEGLREGNDFVSSGFHRREHFIERRHEFLQPHIRAGTRTPAWDTKDGTVHSVHHLPHGWKGILEITQGLCVLQYSAFS